MNAITGIRDVQNALSGETSHEALVGIAAFATTHLQEMSELESDQKNELFSRLVTESYEAEELEPVTTLAEQFFKEKLGESFDRQGLSHLSQTEKLHLFRYVNQSKLSTSHASSLTKMSKRKRERIIYRSMLAPLLRERVQGKELEGSIRKCIQFLQCLPESKREEHLHLFRKYLPLLPAISNHFEELLRDLPAESDKLPHIKKIGGRFTDPAHLKYFLQGKDENDIHFFETLLDSFPNLNLRKDFSLLSDSLRRNLISLNELVQKIPLLSKSQTPEEAVFVALLSAMPPETKESFKPLLEKFSKIFPKLNSGHGQLLYKAIRLGGDKVNKVLETLNQKPFTDIVSGEKLLFIIEKTTEPNENLELLKQFCTVFPNVQSNFNELYTRITGVADEGTNQLLQAVEQFKIGELPITDGKKMNEVILPVFNGLISYDQFSTHFQLLKTCVDSFPKITDYDHLSEVLSITPKSQREILNLIPSGFSFIDSNDLRDTLSFLENMSFLKRTFWGGQTALLASFKKEVLDAFPKALDGVHYKLESYVTNQEVWQFMKGKEPFSKETSGMRLVNYAEAFDLKQFKNSSHRDAVLGLVQHIQRTFKITQDRYLINSLKSLQNGEKLLDLIPKLAPDAISYFARSPSELSDLLNRLNPLGDEEKTKTLTLFQRHVQNSFFLELQKLNKIPLDAQESILNLLDGVDFLGEITDYTSLVTNLSEIEETKRAQHLRLYQRHLEYAQGNISQLILIPVEEQKSILDLLDGVGLQGKIRDYKSVVEKLSQLPLKEQEVLFSKNGKLHAIFNALKTKESKADFLESFINLPKLLQPLALKNFELLLKLVDSPDLIENYTLLNNLALTPSSLLTSIKPQENSVESLYQELRKFENSAAFSEHLISLLNEAASDQDLLRKVIGRVEIIQNDLRLGDEDSPLGQTIIHYETLLSGQDKVNAWTIYQDHKKRLASDEKLPFPSLGVINGTPMLFNYEKLQSVSATADKLPKGVDFANLQALTKAFLGRFNGLDQSRKEAIRSYLKETLPNFETIDDLVKTMNQPWWEYNLRAPDSGLVSQTSWKLFNAVAYIAQEDSECSMELPGIEDTPENFELKEKLLSSQERALLMLLGQVQYCDSGKEGGLEQFVALQPGVNALSGAVQEGISEAILTYLQREVIGSDAFLEELIGGGTSQPYHDAQYIRNVLSKELKFPLKFDAHTGTITQPLFEKTPEQLLNAVFANIDHPRLYQVICNQVNAFDWKSKEGTELYKNLQGRVPPNELLSCCKFDEDYNFIGITEKAVPYVLIQYGFFSKQK